MCKYPYSFDTLSFSSDVFPNFNRNIIDKILNRKNHYKWVIYHFKERHLRNFERFEGYAETKEEAAKERDKWFENYLKKIRRIKVQYREYW